MKKLVAESLNEDKFYDKYYDNEFHKIGRGKNISSTQQEEDLKKIETFAKENNFKFGINKNQTPYVSIPINYKMIKSYDQLQWPTLVNEIRYTFTYTNWSAPISLRKIWYGYEPKSIDYWGVYPNEKKFKKMFKEMPSDFKIKNLKQSLMGRFNSVEDIFDRILSNIKKESQKTGITNANWHR
jgi:hypothetical protein